jgi:probable F420-dependent oxidoreductase
MEPRRAFRFGVVCARGHSRHDWWEKARKAEQLGYATLLVPDHLQDQLAPVPALLAAADATTTLRIGSHVFANDFRHPVLLAKEAATLDLLSDGRFELGLGAGWMRAEYDQAGLAFEPPGVRVGRLEEAIRLIKQLLSGGPTTFTGTHYTVTDLPELPSPYLSRLLKPVQQPHPPILMGGGGPRLLALAAREADIVSIVLRSRMDGSGLDRADFAAASMARKVRQVQAAAGERWTTLELSTLIQRVVVTDDPYTPATQLGERYGLSPEQVLESPFILLGTVAQLCDVLHARREQYGLSYIAVFEPSMDAFAPVVARLAHQ